MISLPDNRFASGSYDNTIQIWDVTTAIGLKTLESHTGAVLCLVYLGDGHLASGSVDKTIKIWDYLSNLLIKTFDQPHMNSITTLIVLSNNSDSNNSKNESASNSASKSTMPLLVSGSIDSTICIWDVESGLCLHQLKKHSSTINSLISLQNNQLLVSASDDQSIVIWKKVI